MQQVFASKEDQSGTQEDRRRRSEVAAATTVSIPALGGVIPPSSGTPTTLPAITPTILDRFHKWAISGTGGYIMVGLDHAKNDIPGQAPPNNPGAMYLTTVSSVTEAYNMAAAAWALPVVTSSTGRITICVMAGTWTETLPLNFQTSGIDIQGIGMPTIYWNATIMPTCDMQMYEFNSVAFLPLVSGGVNIQPYVDLDAATPKNSFYLVKFFGDANAMVAQGRFNSYYCSWHQTAPAASATVNVPLTIMINAATDLAPTRIRGGSINAIFVKQQLSGGEFGVGVNMGSIPSGFALTVQNLLPGPFSTVGTFGDPLYLWPQAFVELDDVLVMGSLYQFGGRTQHTHCEVHGGIPFLSEVGAVYAVLVAPRFNNGDGSFNGYLGTEVMFDDCVIRSQKIAQFNSNGDLFEHPGMSVVYVNNSPHKTRWDGQAGSPWTTFDGNGTALVCNSGTGSSSWTAGGPTVTLTGSCPDSVLGLRDFYMM
jgi:hypothetical protein